MRDINLETTSIIPNNSKTHFFRKWFADRGLELVDYQQDILSNRIIFNGEPIVLAVSPGGGKTLMSIAAIENYCILNPDNKVLVLTHGQTNLRLQYAEEIYKSNPNFSWAMVVSKPLPNSEIPQLHPKDVISTNAQVIVCLPQSVKNCILPKFDLVVVDEAHQFYFAEMVQSIISKVNSRNQLLLTGTPSPFIANQFKNIIPVSIEILFESHRVSDPIIELAGSTYDFKLSDYNSEYELKNEIKIKTEDTNSTLNLVLKEICKKIGINSSWSFALKKLSKTMLVCRKQQQAEDAYAFFKMENINTALSISDTDKDSDELKRFKNDPSCLILIVVRRGILGFNFPSLINVIDISCSQNIDNLLQLLCRVVRVSPNKEQKYFYKVCPCDLVDHYKYVMTAVLCMTRQNYFIKFNGKHFLDVALPVIMQNGNFIKAKSEINVKKRELSIKRKKSSHKPLEFSGLPAFNFFKNCLAGIDNGALNSYAYTTLRDVIKCYNYWGSLSEDEKLKKCITAFYENDCKSKRDYIDADRSGYNYLYMSGRLNEFYSNVGLEQGRLKMKQMTKEEIFKIYQKKFLEENCKTMNDFYKVEKTGYGYLYRKGLVEEFREQVNSKRKSRNWRIFSKEGNFNFLYNKFVTNKCTGMEDLYKVDKSGYGYLYTQKLMGEFRERYNISRQRKSTKMNIQKNGEVLQ